MDLRIPTFQAWFESFSDKPRQIWNDGKVADSNDCEDREKIFETICLIEEQEQEQEREVAV